MATDVEAPFSMKPFYDEMLRTEDKTEFKKLSELLADTYKAVVPKNNEASNVSIVSFQCLQRSLPLPPADVYCLEVKGFWLRCIWKSYCLLQDCSCYCQFST